MSGCCSLAVVADIKGHQRPGNEAEDESPGTPLQADPDGVAEQNDHHRDGDQREDHPVRAEASHRFTAPSMGVHNSGASGATVPSFSRETLRWLPSMLGVRATQRCSRLWADTNEQAENSTSGPRHVAGPTRTAVGAELLGDGRPALVARHATFG